MFFLQQRKINGCYVPFAVEPERLEQAVAGLWAVGVSGFNVTVPHKEAVMPLVSPDLDAQRIGAVNTVKRSPQGWLATNTDWRGVAAVVKGVNVDLDHSSALLFGAGGTARAVLHALAGLGLETVYICNRNRARLEALLAVANNHYPELHCVPVAWEQGEVTAACQASKLLLNSTSIGLQQGDRFPFNLDVGEGAAMDAVYRPDGSTCFTQAAATSRRVVDGLPMLIAQGAASFAWWHECELPSCSQALRVIEQKLGRKPLLLSGWEDAR